MILKLENINFTSIKILFFKRMCMCNILISNKISSSKKNCEYFIGCIDGDYKINPFIKIPLKTSVYVKSYDSETKWIF